MLNPIRWIRAQFDRYRAWREACANEWMRRFVEEANRPENVARLRCENEKEYGRLFLIEDGFYLLIDDHREFAIRWADIRTVRTFKRDMFAHDMICLAFEIGEDEWVEIWESMVDFTMVTEKMHAEFPTIPEDWYSVVMLPAFETNDRILWRHDHAGTPAQSHGDAR